MPAFGAGSPKNADNENGHEACYREYRQGGRLLYANVAERRERISRLRSAIDVMGQ